MTMASCGVWYVVGKLGWLDTCLTPGAAVHSATDIHYRGVPFPHSNRCNRLRLHHCICFFACKRTAARVSRGANFFDAQLVCYYRFLRSNRPSCLQIVSALYCVITIFSFQNVLDVYWQENTNVKTHRLWAFLAATILAPAMVIGFFAFGTITLLCKTLGEGGLTYSYGALHVSSMWMAILVLLSSVTIHSYKEDMQGWEGSGNSMFFLQSVIGTMRTHS